jgi:H+/gluconate symporter-like permease
MALALAGGLASALTLLPPEVHTTAARVWIGVALFGITVACLAAIAIYVTSEARWKRRQSLRMLSEIPDWAIDILPAEERERYGREFNAHLFELVESGEYKQAEHDRRALMLASFSLAIVIRLQRSEHATD